jgi:L-lactate dehydrogenase complex protein LldF
MSSEDRLSGTTLKRRTATAVADPVLRRNVARAVDRFASHRARGLAELECADDLRHAARAIRLDTIDRLPDILELLADRLLERGVHVAWAPTAADANHYIAALARDRGVGTVVKSKSMATEEIQLNDALIAAGCRVVETDLGEWIIQLAREAPSHIIAPALHRDRHSIRAVFGAVANAPDELGTEPVELNAFARERLREEFLAADMGITGVNFAVAESGSIVLVTNEGNGRFVSTLPDIHVAVLGMERVVATWDELDLLLALLTRSATGQRLTSYTNVITGPRGVGEVDGPRELHVVILDNGRAELLGSEHHDMLTCIRCGACLNVCPVYRQVGGHAYGWVYPGPMGAVLTPLLASQPEAAEVPNASTLCGACMDACPVEIPLQDHLLALRRRRASTASNRVEQLAWRAWAAAWSNPRAYRTTARAASIGRRMARAAARLPVGSSWAAGRSVPTPARRSFRERWSAGEI